MGDWWPASHFSNSTNFVFTSFALSEKVISKKDPQLVNGQKTRTKKAFATSSSKIIASKKLISKKKMN